MLRASEGNLLNDEEREVHLIAETLLEVETLELEQIKRLMETGELKTRCETGSDTSEEQESRGQRGTDGGEQPKVNIKTRTMKTTKRASSIRQERRRTSR